MRSFLVLLVLLSGAPALAQDAPPANGPAAAAQPMEAPPAQPAEGETQAPAEAQAEPAAAEEESSAATGVLSEMLDSGAIGMMREGGIFMWPILLLGILAAGVIIERYRSLKMLTTDTGALRSRVQQLLHDDQVEDALQLCDGEQGPVPAVLTVGLRKFLVLKRLNYDPGRIEEQVVKSMDDYSVHIVAALERHLPVLATVSSAAPMLGFLGTVQGMILAFGDIVAKMGETNIVEAAAAGIQTALLTTCLGLVVGIPAFIAYNYFTSVINRFVLEVEESATELIEAVTLQTALESQQAENLAIES